MNALALRVGRRPGPPGLSTHMEALPLNVIFARDLTQGRRKFILSLDKVEVLYLGSVTLVGQKY